MEMENLKLNKMQQNLRDKLVDELIAKVDYFEPIYYIKDDYFICHFKCWHSKANVIFEDPIFKKIQKDMDSLILGMFKMERFKIQEIYQDNVLKILDKKDFNHSIWYDFMEALYNNKDFKTAKDFSLLQNYINEEIENAFTFRKFLNDLQNNNISNIEALRRLVALTRDYPSMLLNIFIAELKNTI